MERKYLKLVSLGVEIEFLVDRKVLREVKLRKDVLFYLKVSLVDSYLISKLIYLFMY